MSSKQPELSTVEVEEMKKWFVYFDKDKNGMLDQNEFKRAVQAMCWDFSDEEFEDLFTKADTDKNGFIDYEEYWTLLQSCRKNVQLEKLELKESFRVLDKEKKGMLERKKLRKFLLNTSGIDVITLDKLLSIADTRDTGSINIDEFVELMTSPPDQQAKATK
ncbi:CALM-like protein [Mya arenaria]|uniref:CALM-like protein n=1 Tax=Mya arenaria TaxID=6604 RepID=A0ABY7E5X9_MYAAR|nr:uncharacterized protein LOC128235350 [Mya arenaria]WAR04345.1 CALM-like protein [Mya arenaria]